MTREELIEALADKEHASWARWMDYLFSKCEHNGDGSLTIPSHLVTHWDRQVNTEYAWLTDRERQSDRDEVAHILPFIERYRAAAERSASDGATRDAATEDARDGR